MYAVNKTPRPARQRRPGLHAEHKDCPMRYLIIACCLLAVIFAACSDDASDRAHLVDTPDAAESDSGADAEVADVSTNVDALDDAGEPDAGADACTCATVDGCCDGCEPINPGDACDDGLTCTLGTTCQSDGTCGASTSSICDNRLDEPQCQSISCDEITGCSYVENIREGFECDDDDNQTYDDECVRGACLGSPCECLGESACCDGCFAINEGGSCNDGDEWTSPDQCLAGACQGEPLPKWIDISTNGSVTCAVKDDGNVFCWGENRFGQLNVPENALFLEVEVVSKSVCGINLSNQIECWGEPYNSFSDSIPDFEMTGLSCIGSKCCGFAINPPELLNLRSNVYCFGDNAPYASQQPNIPLKKFSMSGDKCSCGISDQVNSSFINEDEVYCWGQDMMSYGDNFTSKYISAIPLGVGCHLGCAINKYSNQVECVSDSFPAIPGQYEALIGATSGYCAVDSLGNVRCQPREPSTYAPPFLLTPAPGRFKKLVTGGWSACGIKMDGHLACWGQNTTNHFPPAGF